MQFAQHQPCDVACGRRLFLDMCDPPAQEIIVATQVIHRHSPTATVLLVATKAASAVGHELARVTGLR